MSPGADRSRRGVLVAVLAGLFVLNLVGLVVFERVEDGLQAEERERLSFMARTLGLEIARRLPSEISGDAGLAALGERLERARRLAALDAVFLADRDGMVLVEAREEGVRVRARLVEDAERGVVRETWGGAEAYAPAEGEGRRLGGYFCYPIFSLGGEVRYALVMVAGAAFRERLARISPMLLLSRSFGVVLLLLFAAFLLVTLRRTVRAAGAAAPAGARGTARADRPGTSDTDFVIQTFQEIVTNLRESESELKSLYSRAEERARTIERTVAYMLRGLPTGVVIFDRDRRVLLMNAAARQILRLPKRDHAGEPAEAVLGGDGELVRLLDEALTGGKTRTRHEVRIARAGEEESWIGLSTSVVRDRTGGVIGGAFLIADLTEARRARKREELRDRLAAMGEMSAGLAHELRNSLATLLGYCRLLDRALDAEAPSRPHLARLVEEVRLLERTTDRLLEFVRPGRRGAGPVEVEALLRAAADAVLERRPEPRPEVVFCADAAGATVDGDAAALRKALENVIENAYDAMPRGGTLTLSARCAAPHGDEAEGSPAGQVEIAVLDTGAGIPPEQLSRVFVPFFTTKESGTGLGLALVQKTIAEHDGTVEVASAPGRGTTVRILLPCRVDAAGSAASRPAPGVAGGPAGPGASPGPSGEGC